MSTSGLSAASDIRVVKIVQASDIVGVEELVGRLGVVALVVSLLAMILSCGPPTTGYFANLEFSPDLHPIPSHPLSPEPHVGSFYFVFHTGTGLTEVDHLRQDGPATPPTVLLFLEMNRDHMLDRTVKSIQLMKGRFGTVYAERTCFFNRPPETSWSNVSVHSYFNSASREVPSELSPPPSTLPPLTSLSLVRIYRAFPEYLVVAANYEQDGELGSLHIDGAKDGNWLHSNDVPAAQHVVHRPTEGWDLGLLRQYGIPERIDVQSYLRSHHIPLPPASLPQEVAVLNQHYGYDKFIRLDELGNGTVISSRFLQPSDTDEEQVLNPQCESRFRQQQKLGLPTVE